VNKKIKPRVFRGLRDWLPEEMSARLWIIDTIREVYERYGFAPLSTPAIEYYEALTGSAGTEIQSTLFRVNNPDRGDNPGDDALGLRFDLTVPLARVISQYRDLPRPFRRYQVASVYRADKPDPGRFREFTQFDLDTVGAPTTVADVEIMSAMCDTLSALDVGPYQVRFSSRSILNLLLQFAEIPAEIEVGKDDVRPGTDVFRVLDKLDKIGAKKVRLELTTGYKDESGDDIPGLGLSSEQVDLIEQFLAIKSTDRNNVLTQLTELFAGVEGAQAEIDVLREMSDQLAMLGYGNDRVVIDLSIARGLAYYTGPVYEAILLDAPEFGSVFAGGRYDELVTRFIGEKIPATGASLGVDRLLAALIHLKRVKLEKTPTKVLVTMMDLALSNDYLEMTWELRQAGIPCEMFLGSKRKGIGKQMKYADSLDIPLAVMFGEDEKAKGIVTIKDLQQGRAESQEIEGREQWIRERPGQIEIPRGELVERIKALLADQDR